MQEQLLKDEIRQYERSKGRESSNLEYPLYTDNLHTHPSPQFTLFAFYGPALAKKGVEWEKKQYYFDSLLLLTPCAAVT